MKLQHKEVQLLRLAIFLKALAGVKCQRRSPRKKDTSLLPFSNLPRERTGTVKANKSIFGFFVSFALKNPCDLGLKSNLGFSQRNAAYVEVVEWLFGRSLTIVARVRFGPDRVLIPAPQVRRALFLSPLPTVLGWGRQAVDRGRDYMRPV